MLFFHRKNETIEALENVLHLLKTSDPDTLQYLNQHNDFANIAQTTEERRQKAIAACEQSIAFARAEHSPEGHTYHSRDPLAGIMQSVLAAAGDNVVPELQAFGQGNPVVWAPTGVDALLEHFRAKAPFKIATKKSLITLPPKCKIALLSDWGADNDHAKRIATLAVERGADLVIHLGDIYYSGTEGECRTFLRNWPLRDEHGNPAVGKSFALNGNHEMYTLGRNYFTTVLDGFGQEASYFTLTNDWWQFHGLDTAYVPFSISGGDLDSNLRPQWNWLMSNLKAGATKKNVFLSHNQPVSAHLAEFEQSYPLQQEWRKVLSEAGADAIFAWFFGHEHRCAIYDDAHTEFRARLIGNGAIPHHPQEEAGADKDETGASATPFLKVNKQTIGDGEVAISTFAMITLDHGSAHVEYINEDGSLFHEENW